MPEPPTVAHRLGKHEAVTMATRLDLRRGMGKPKPHKLDEIPGGAPVSIRIDGNRVVGVDHKDKSHTVSLPAEIITEEGGKEVVRVKWKGKMWGIFGKDQYYYFPKGAVQPTSH